VTLNDLEQRNSPYFAYFTELMALRPITSLWLKMDLYCLPLLATTAPPCSMVFLR